MKINDILAQDHPYYGSGVHQEVYNCFDDFIREMDGYDVDLNLCYRFDITKEDDGMCSCSIITILQRKGKCCEHIIRDFKDADIPKLKKYLAPHRLVIEKLMKPIF